MTLPTLPTLAYVRGEILQRCGLGTRGNQGARAIPMVDSAIRQAIRTLQVQFPWTRLQTTKQIPLITGTTQYDFPDTMDDADIEFVGAHNLSANRVTQMQPDPDRRLRNAYVNTTLTCPRYYWFEDGVINITPSPDATVWDYLVLDGYAAAVLPVNDADLVPFDGEAIIQMAEMLSRPRMGLDVPPNVMQALTGYLNELRSRQGDGEGTMPGGTTSYKVRPENGGNRTGYAGPQGWTTDWNPGSYGGWGP